MSHKKHLLNVIISQLVVLTMVFGNTLAAVSMPPAITAPSLRETDPSTSARTIAQQTDPPVVEPSSLDGETEDFFVYLPLVHASSLSDTAVIEPGVGGEIESPDGSVHVAFTTIAVTQTTQVKCVNVAPPTVPPNNLAVAGQAFSLTAQFFATGEPVSHFPYQVKVFTDTSPWYSVYTPSVIITKTYTDPEVWGLDLSVLSLYRRTGPGPDDWVKVPSAVYLDQNYMVAQVETIGEFAVMSRLAIYNTGTSGQTGALAIQSPMTNTRTIKKLVLDPDRNEGWAVWPGVGKVKEGPYAVRLAKAVRDRLQNDRCRADILLTREDENAYGELPSVRAQIYQQFGGDTLATFAFNSSSGAPWGYEGDGGAIIWSGGDSDDDAFRDTMGSWIGNLNRPVQYDRSHAVLPYADFVALSGGYMHMETLYLDHNYDWPIINTGFDAIADMAYAGVRAYLESKGMYCGDDPDNPPPYPEPPSEALLQRWHDLGYQNYQRYGADPVSFSTGNHVVQARLTRIPARGGLDWDLTLTYNSQDTRDDLFGYNWSFPYNARLQAYTDDSVTVALQDGRTYHYTPNGSGYDAPAGVFDRLEKTEEGWQWITPDDVTLTFSETVGGFGILTEWRDRNDNALHFSYDLSGQDAWQDGEDVPRPPLTTIRNDAGREISVTSNDDSHITRLDLWDGRAYTFEYDGEGNLTRINGPDGQLRRFAYDSRHRMTKEWDAEGILFLQSTYDDRDRAIEQIDASGTHSYLDYDVANRQTTFTDNAGNSEVYSWDALNRVTGEQDASGSSVSNVYDADYNLTARTDANGNTTRYEYDDRGNVIARYDPIPRGADYGVDVTRWAYDEHNQVISKTNALEHTWQYAYDEHGNRTCTVYPDGSETRKSYNDWRQPLIYTDANGHVTRYKYDQYGNRTHVIDHYGNETISEYDAAGREISYTDTNGHTVHFEYDDNDNLVQIIDPKGQSSQFCYDRNNLLVRSIDRNGGETLYEYDENWKIIGERDAEGRWTRYGYNVLYQRTVMTDTLGNTTHYVYDIAGRLEHEIDVNGGVTRYEYDAHGNQTTVINALGHRTRKIYDANHRLKYLIAANGTRTEYCYDAEDRLVRTIGPRGEVTDYTYNAINRLISVKDPLGNVTRYEYDATGNRIAVIDPLGNRTDTTYDALNRTIAVEEPALEGGARPTTRYTYDPVGNTLSITSPRGFATTYTYDVNDNLLTVNDSLGGQRSYTYDAEDRRTATTDANGNTTTTTFDLTGLTLQVQDPLGNITRNEYNSARQLVRVTNPLSQTTVYSYDAIGQLQYKTDPLGNVTSYTRDALGRITTLTDANGNMTHYDYDAMGQVLAVTNALSGTTRYAYDLAGNTTIITDANGNTTTFAYNFLNQLKRRTNPLHKSWWYDYDASGQLIKRVDAMWRAKYYDYDSNGRLVGIQYGTQDPQPPVTYTYDLEDNQTQMCDGLGCATHTYDALNRIITSSDWLGHVITRGYDLVGNLTSVKYPNGYIVTYAYDANNQLIEFTDPHGDTTAYVYDATGYVTRADYANSTESTFTRDGAGRLVGVDNRQTGADHPQSAYDYMLDRMSNWTQVQETHAAFNSNSGTVTLNRTYEYDALNRLIRASTDNPNTGVSYTFDAMNNRLTKQGTVLVPDPNLPVLPVAPQPEDKIYAYNSANQLTAVNDALSGTDTNLKYDSNGNRVQEEEILDDGTVQLTHYTYNRENRLVGIHEQASTINGISTTMSVTYTYDAYARRATKVVVYPDDITATEVITYLYKGNDIIGAQLAINGNVTETYYYLAPSPLNGKRRPVEMERLPNAEKGFAGDRYWYQYDGAGSIAGLTDEAGELVSPYLYDEYGKVLTGKLELQFFAFVGMRYDAETGFYEWRGWVYDPVRGIPLQQQNPLLLGVNLLVFGLVMFGELSSRKKRKGKTWRNLITMFVLMGMISTMLVACEDGDSGGGDGGGAPPIEDSSEVAPDEDDHIDNNNQGKSGNGSDDYGESQKPDVNEDERCDWPSAPPTSEEPYTIQKVLQVPHVDQTTYDGDHNGAGEYICAAASLTMTLKYHLGAGNVSLDKVADGLIDEGYLDERGLLSGDYLESFIQDHQDIYNVNAKYEYKGFDKSWITSRINNDSPIILNVPGHYTLISGYAKKQDGTYLFHMSDPYRGHWRSGSNVVLNKEWITQDELEEIWRHRTTVVSKK
jgi:YD repeat-containing protein